MRLGLVGHLIAGAWCQVEGASIGQFGMQLAFQAQQNMPFRAPVIGHVAGAVLHHPYANRAEFARSPDRSEEHTSELQSLMRISYAVFCLKKKTSNKHSTEHRLRAVRQE